MVLWCNRLVQEYKKYAECEHFAPLPGAAAFLVAGLAAGAFAGSLKKKKKENKLNQLLQNVTS